MRLAVAMTPTRGAPSIAVVSPTRVLPVIPCDPTPPRLDVVAVDQVRVPLDRMTARSCVSRQGIAGGAEDARSTWAAGGGASQRYAMSMCRDCEIGRAIAKAVRS